MTVTRPLFAGLIAALALLSAAGLAACGSTDEEIELGAVGVEAEVGALALVVDDAEPTTPLRITIPAGETVYTSSSGEADLILAGMDKSSRYLAEIEEGDA